MTYSAILLIILFTHSTFCSQCFKHVFNENLEDNFTNTEYPCNTVPNPGLWTRSSYNNSPIERPHKRSDWYISPSSTVSCIRSVPITMEHTGHLKVNVYMEHTDIDYLYVMVIGPDETTLGTGILFPTSSPHTEWRSINIKINNFFATGPFEGYVVFMGMVTQAGGIIMVDSFRYIPPHENEDTCVVYEDEESSVTTTEPTSTTTEPPIKTTATDLTTSEPATIEVVTYQCFRYDFGDDYEEKCSNCKIPCTSGNYRAPWVRKSYNDSAIDRPNFSRKEWYIAPNPQSCFVSFPFPVQRDGRVIVNFYWSTLTSHPLTFTVHNINGQGAAYTPNLRQADTWQSVSIRVLADLPEAYVAFTGRVTNEKDIVMIDSFRYVPPGQDEYSCDVYELSTTTTTPATTTREPTTTTKDPITTTTESTNTTTNPITSPNEPTKTTTTSKPITTTTEPTTITTEPITTTSEPTNTTKEPTISPNEPAITTVTTTTSNTTTTNNTTTTVTTTTTTTTINTASCHNWCSKITPTVAHETEITLTDDDEKSRLFAFFNPLPYLLSP